MLVAALAAVAISVAPADAAIRHASLVDIQDEVMCPVCGVPLSIAGDAPLARRERIFIVALIDRGRTKSEIKRALVNEFGEGVLTMPRNRGFGRTAYLVPAGGAIVGLTVAVVCALRWRRRRSAAEGSLATATSEADRRLDADIGSYDL
jgi:cytochrome c-type biogenesis protein CcmH/NrfF